MQKHIHDDAEMESPIQQFYKGKTIFITGASGFIGKVLLERLLVTCPDIEAIYIMVREKKGHSVSTRVEKILNAPLFRHVDPRVLDKVHPIVGELGASALGLSTEDYQMLTQKTDIVIHCAANVRFDISLKDLIKDNVRGTSDVMQLCRKMKRLVSFMYVSTLYCHYNHTVIEEKVYEPRLDLETALGLEKVSAEDSDVLEIINEMLVGREANKYTFTKSLSEKVVMERGRGLPVCIFRPGVVMPTSREHPVPGYIDSMHAAVPMAVGLSTGLVRLYLGRRHQLVRMLPADYCAHAIIAALWETANRGGGEEPRVFNYIPKDRAGWFVEQVVDNIVGHARKEPLDQLYGYPFSMVIESITLFRLLSIFVYLIPAVLADLLSALLRKPPVFVKTYRRIMKQSTITQNVFQLEYNFQKRNTIHLQTSLSPVDQRLFRMDLNEVSIRDNMPVYIRGMKHYLLKEKMDTSKEALRKLRLFKNIFYGSLTLLSFFGVVVFLFVLHKFVF